MYVFWDVIWNYVKKIKGLREFSENVQLTEDSAKRLNNFKVFNEIFPLDKLGKEEAFPYHIIPR